MARLDRLATQGVRPPGSIIPQDFGGKIDYLSDIDHHHLPPTAWGEYDALPEGHVLRAKLKREDAYDHQGKAYVFLGRAISGDMGSRHLPWIPLDVVVKQTLSLSTPQKASRKAKADQDRADDDRRHQQWENSKTVHERNLEAQLAEARKEIAEMKAAGLRTAGVA